MAADAYVSVIIPAYNAEDTIAAAIEAVLAQDYAGPFELVIVDDGSTDRMADAVGLYSGVRYIRQENAGPASARNHGASIAQGSVFIFTDADCCPEPSWVSKMVEGFSRQDVSVVAGSYGIANPSSCLARVIHAEIVFRHRVLMSDFPKAFGSYNFGIRRDVFEAVGGFNTQYRRASGEDNDLSYKILAHGGRIFFRRDACVLHYHQEVLSRYLQEQFRHGVWRLKMYADYPAMMAGDGYTFWKDIAEIPLAASHVLVFLWPLFAAVLCFGFFFFEVVFGGIFMGPGFDMFFAGYVFWLRSFTRTAGFLTGAVFFLSDIIRGVKNNKKNLRVTSTMLI